MKGVDFQRQRPRMSVAEYVSGRKDPKCQASPVILMEPSIHAIEAARRICTVRNIGR